MEPNKWFDQHSMIRQVSQEALGLLGGGRAILLQLAHPLVAAGVAEHSDFQKDPLSRLLRTLELMHAIVHGNHDQATQALQQFHAVHAHVKGHLSLPAGPFPEGTTYNASDPELGRWVFATLINTSVIIYERFVAPLTPDERDRFYADACVLGRLLGLPSASLPPTFDEFEQYVAEMLAGNTLVVTDTARQLGRDVLHPDVGIIPATSALLLRFVTAGTLPRRLSHAYGLQWNARRQHLLEMLSRTTRTLRPIAPVWVWQSPQLGGSLARWLLWQVVKSETDQ